MFAIVVIIFNSVPIAVYVIGEVARGLAYAHHLCDPGGRPLNVVHQDISPHNVLLSYEGDVKLVDFGIARVGEATAGGVPLSADECDDILPVVLYPGKYILATDGAGAYQSVAHPSRVAYHTEGEDPDSFKKERYEKYYKKLKLSHVIVSHKAEQWATVDKVQYIDSRGVRRTIPLKKGTQIVDGLWPELRGGMPDSVHTKDWNRCRTRVPRR